MCIFPLRYGHGEYHCLIPDGTGQFMGIEAINDTMPEPLILMPSPRVQSILSNHQHLRHTKAIFT